ncbi:hypothetical protein EDD21DRAFT_224658, partial [Dissophora ornata]
SSLFWVPIHRHPFPFLPVSLLSLLSLLSSFLFPPSPHPLCSPHRRRRFHHPISPHLPLLHPQASYLALPLWYENARSSRRAMFKTKTRQDRKMNHSRGWALRDTTHQRATHKTPCTDWIVFLQQPKRLSWTNAVDIPVRACCHKPNSCNKQRTSPPCRLHDKLAIIWCWPLSLSPFYISLSFQQPPLF